MRHGHSFRSGERLRVSRTPFDMETQHPSPLPEVKATLLNWRPRDSNQIEEAQSRITCHVRKDCMDSHIKVRVGGGLQPGFKLDPQELVRLQIPADKALAAPRQA